MGTRSTYWIGSPTDENCEYLGYYAWDGYPSGKMMFQNVTTEEDYRKAVEQIKIDETNNAYKDWPDSDSKFNPDHSDYRSSFSGPEKGIKHDFAYSYVFDRIRKKVFVFCGWKHWLTFDEALKLEKILGGADAAHMGEYFEKRDQINGYKQHEPDHYSCLIERIETSINRLDNQLKLQLVETILEGAEFGEMFLPRLQERLA